MGLTCTDGGAHFRRQHFARRRTHISQSRGPPGLLAPCRFCLTRAGENDNEFCRCTKSHDTKPFRRALRSWREGFAHREDGAGDQAPGRSSAGTPPPAALSWAGLGPTGVLGAGVPLPRLLNIDFTNADVDVIEVSASAVPQGSPDGTSALLRSKGSARRLHGGC